MKKILLAIILISFGVIGKAQNEETSARYGEMIFSYYNDFEESIHFDEYNYNYNDTVILDYNVLGLDSLWMSGIPDKSEWDTNYLNYSKPRALLTDTVHPYPPNIHSVIELRAQKPLWAISSNLCWSIFVFKFEFACDTDSLKDGMYLEISFDNGQNFANLLDTVAVKAINNGPDNVKDYSIEQESILNDSIKGFTGKVFDDSYTQGGNDQYLQSFSIVYGWDEINALDINEAIIQIHFLSDSIDNQRQGIMIDYLNINVVSRCNLNSVKIQDPDQTEPSFYYDQSNNKTKLRFNNNYTDVFQLTLFDSYGRAVYKDETKNNYFGLDNYLFSSGIYFYYLYSENKCYTGKIIF